MGLGQALGGLAQPLGGLLVVGLHAHALGEADPEIEGGNEVPRGRRLLEPLRHACGIFGIAGTLEHEIGKVDLRALIAGERRYAQPAGRLLRVARDPVAVQIQGSQGTGRGLMSGLGGAAVPARGLGIVRRQIGIVDVEIARPARRLPHRRPAPPGATRFHR